MSLKKLPAYLQQRYPVVVMLLFVILTLTIYRVAFRELQQEVIWTDFTWWTAALAVISFFFRLRVMDEIKDKDLDKSIHPERLVVKGEISIRELIWISIPGTLFEFGWSFTVSTECGIYWLIALVFSFLMRYEFFVKSWLEPKLFLYAISHTLIMPLVVIWIWQSTSAQVSSEYLYLLMLIAFFAALAFEVARKSYLPQEEPDLIPTYTKLWQAKGAVVGILTLLAVNGLGVLVLFYKEHIAYGYWPIPIIAWLFCVVLYLSPLFSNSEIPFRKGEQAVSLVMVLNYSLLIALL